MNTKRDLKLQHLLEALGVAVIMAIIAAILLYDVLIASFSHWPAG